MRVVAKRVVEVRQAASRGSVEIGSTQLGRYLDLATSCRMSFSQPLAVGRLVDLLCFISGDGGGQAMQEDQKLMVEFRDFANILIRMLNNCIKEPQSHLAVFVMHRDVNARLDFIQVSFAPEYAKS